MTDEDREYVLVTEYFHPETAATGQLMTDLATGLQNRGLDMTVYTGQPNYHSGESGTRPSVSVYEDVLVYRFPGPQLRQTSTVRRGVNWFAFTLWVFFSLLVSRPSRDRELLFVTNPPFLPPVLWLVCRIRGWEYTYIVHDVYPDAAGVSGYPFSDGFVARAWEALQARTLADANHVVALGPEMRTRLRELCGKHSNTGRIEVIHNWADGTFIRPREKEDNWFAREHGLVDTFTVLYSGNMGVNHDLETVVRAAAQLEDEPVTFLVIGNGDKKELIKAYADRLGVAGETVQFLPYQDLEDLPYTLTAGDVSVVTVSDGMKGVCVSSKLYTSMATGAPILVVSEPGDDEATIVEQHDAGFHARQGDIDAVVEAITTWLDDPDVVEQQGSNAREAFENHYTKERSIDQYYELLTGVAVSDHCE